jgi:hypothetical protein
MGTSSSDDVEHSDNKHLVELEPDSSTLNRFGFGNGYIASAGGAESFDRFAGALGDDWYSYPGVETCELTPCGLASGISIACADDVLTGEVSYSPSDGCKWNG